MSNNIGDAEQSGTRSSDRNRRWARRGPEIDMSSEEADLGGDEESESEFSLVRTERYRPLPRANELQGCRCVCVWPKDRVSINRMWHIIRQELHPHGDRVAKIVRVSQ